MDEMIELKDCLLKLESALETLDRVGAGIAAIHVDAAIEQLQGNIDIVVDDGGDVRMTGLLRRPQFGRNVH